MISKLLILALTIVLLSLNNFIFTIDEHLYVTQDATKITFLEPEPEFNLDLLPNITDNEFERNYKNIVETVRRKGPKILNTHLNHSELIRLAYNDDHGENATFIHERWNNVMDFFLDEGNQQFFKWYVLNKWPIYTTVWWGPTTAYKGNMSRRTYKKRTTTEKTP